MPPVSYDGFVSARQQLLRNPYERNARDLEWQPWWTYGLVGAAVVAVGTGVYFATRPDDASSTGNGSGGNGSGGNGSASSGSGIEGGGSGGGGVQPYMLLADPLRPAQPRPSSPPPPPSTDPPLSDMTPTSTFMPYTYRGFTMTPAVRLDLHRDTYDVVAVRGIAPFPVAGEKGFSGPGFAPANTFPAALGLGPTLNIRRPVTAQEAQGWSEGLTNDPRVDAMANEVVARFRQAVDAYLG